MNLPDGWITPTWECVDADGGFDWVFTTSRDNILTDTGRVLRSHVQQPVTYPFTGKTVLIDELVLPLLLRVWDFGIQTRYCCQGTPVLWPEGYDHGRPGFDAHIVTESSAEATRLAESGIIPHITLVELSPEYDGTHWMSGNVIFTPPIASSSLAAV